MEMNTRLQVEHPVTEEITGEDLVEWQLRVASGEKLPKRQDELAITGHAIEARLYAEDPAKGFLPSVGRLEHFDLGEDGRIDTGVEEGDAISPFYDPMIAKLIAHGDDRDEAIAGLADMLDEVEVWPVRTNAGFLFNALLHRGFRRRPTSTPASSSATSTSWSPIRSPTMRCGAARRRSRRPFPRTNRFRRPRRFRLNAAPQASVALGRGGDFRTVALDDERRWRRCRASATRSGWWCSTKARRTSSR